MSDKRDWANISDDEDESSEDSPENIPSDQPVNRLEEPNEETKPSEREEAKPVDSSKTQGRRDNQNSEEDQKADLVKEIESLSGPKIFLNIYNLEPGVKAEAIREFYQPVTITTVIANQTKAGVFDLEVSSKEDAIKIVQKGTGNLGKSKFCLRTSRRNYPKDYVRPNDKKDRGNKNYGQKGQGGRGGYDNQNRGNYTSNRDQEDYYYQKNQEGGQRNYERKNQDNRYGNRQDKDYGSWKNQGGSRGETQYQARTKGQQEERKNEVDPNRSDKQEEQQFGNARQQEQNAETSGPDRWEKGLQLPDESRNKEYKKKDDYQRRDDNQRNYKNDKYQMKKYNSDYTEGGYGYSNKGQGYRGGEDNSDTIEKGRGTKKYNQDEPLEQDKILQLKDKQSSYKSQGSDKGYYKKDYNKDYNKGYDKGYGGGHNDNYNKSHYYNDQKGYAGRPKDEAYKVYTKKSENQEYGTNPDTDASKRNQEPTGSTPTNKEKGGPPELVKKSSKNTANPFSVLEK